MNELDKRIIRCALKLLALGVFLGFVMGQGNEDLLQVIRPIHEFFTNAVTVVIVLRILAALYHHFVTKDVASAKLLPNRLIY